MRKATSKLRNDGEKTRERLIEEAGKLVAEKGWSAVTARDVCQNAGTNAASINYWFGGRDSLYQAVLGKIPQTIFSQELEIEMVQYESSEAALDFYFSSLIQRVLQEENWPIRVWVREVVAPSPQFYNLIMLYGKERITHLKTFFANYLGIENYEDQRVEAVFVASMAPVFLMAIADPKVKEKMLPSSLSQTESFSKLLKEQVMAGLNSARERLKDSSD